MRALVTGGLGFIGGHLVDRLVAEGHEVTVIDSDLDAPARGDRVIREPMQDCGRPEADAVFHLAGPVGPVGVLGHAGRMATEIVEMAEWLRPYVERGAPVTFVSTSEVYGAQPSPTGEGAPSTFAAGHSARMEYAVAKLAAETMLLNMGGEVVVVRPFNVAGPRQRPDGGFVLPRFLGQARDGLPLTVYEPGTQRRAFTHVADVVGGILLAGERGEGVYNLGNPDNECSVMELAREVLDLTGSASAIEVVDPATLWGPLFREAPDKVPDVSRMRALGWRPWRSREQAILEAWEAMAPVAVAA